MRLPLVRPEWRNFDPFFASLILLLSVLGIFFISSASGGLLGEGSFFGQEPLKQAMFLGISIVAFVAILHLDYQWIARHSYILYLVAIGALFLVLVIGTRSGGGLRWFRIGPLRLQPSEFMKVALILALARFLQYHDGFHSIRGLLRPFILTLGPMALILVQPDLGTALCCLPVLFVMLFAAGARAKHLVLIVLLGIAAAPVIFEVGLKEYQRTRITAFWNPGMEGSRQGAGYHLAQSKVAIGSGSWFGKGFGRGDVPVPVQSTDFIFSAVGEEGGLFGGLAVIVLYLLLMLYLLGIAARTRERFGFLVICGTCALLAFQSLVNIAMTMGLAPITGLTLPLFSYGGSSLLTTFVLLAFVKSIEMRRLRPFGDTGPMSAPTSAASCEKDHLRLGVAHGQLGRR